MAATEYQSGRIDVADRVLRRAQVSKMTRALQDSLALANIKFQQGQPGWQHRSINSIDAELARKLKRKRLDTNVDFFSDSASSVSGSVFSNNNLPLSSPLSGPVFSDEVTRSASSQGSTKRYKPTAQYIHPSQTQHRPSKQRQSRSSQNSWKTSYHLPESSPIRPQRLRSALGNVEHPSFVSESSTIMDSPSSPEDEDASEDDDQDLPLHSFQTYPDTSHIPSSPPRTPSPDLTRSARLAGKASTPLMRYNNAGKEGADLLLFLASSPTPKVQKSRSSPQMAPPSTPPSKSTPLPSSMMTTPGVPLFAFGTPNAAFDFADYCNVTPSPAQKRWASTPKAKTPVTGGFRRREGLMAPPVISPNMTRTTSKKNAGLGMEFGGQLMK